MSRDLQAANLAATTAAHVHQVRMVKFEFDVPVYVHSGIGTISYDGDDYLGVGALGSISNTTEKLRATPSSITITASSVDAALVAEALDAGNFGDRVTIFTGFRGDDGLLVADPEIEWSGYFDHATAAGAVEDELAFICQHDLAVLNRNDGRRFSNASQVKVYPGDTGLQFTSDTAGRKLIWGGGPVGSPRGGGGRPRGDQYLR